MGVVKSLLCYIGIHDMTWGMTSEGYHEWCRRDCGFRVDGYYKRENVIPKQTQAVEQVSVFIKSMVKIWK